MKYLAIFTLSVFLLLSGWNVHAQNLNVLISQKDTFKVRATQRDGKFAIDHFILQPKIPPLTKSFFKLTDLKIAETDLVFDYFLKKRNKIEKYDIFIRLTTPTGRLFEANPRRLFGTFESISLETREMSGQITWEGILDLEPYMEGDYWLEITVLGFSSYDLECDKGPPEFDSKKKLPYNIMGGTGLGLIAAGLVVKVRADSKYKEYLGSVSTEEADELYDRANDQRHLSLIMMASGVIISMASAYLFSRGKKKIQHKRKLYQQYCDPETRRPRFSFTAPADLPVGIGVAFQF